jgi:predicted CoA-binding protein
VDKRVAVLGASTDHRKFGNKSVRAHQRAGWDVVPVSLSGEEVEGLPTYRKLDEIPGDLDRITVYLPPPVGLRMLDEIAAKPAGEIWFNPGADSPALIAEAKKRGLKVIAACSIVELGVSPGQFPDA